jgi:hypothetical protein
MARLCGTTKVVPFLPGSTPGSRALSCREGARIYPCRTKRSQFDSSGALAPPSRKGTDLSVPNKATIDMSFGALAPEASAAEAAGEEDYGTALRHD